MSHLRRSIKRTTIPLTLALVILLPAFAARAAETMLFGIYPLLEVTEVVKRFTPLARYLEEVTGRKVEIEVAKDYQEHIERTGRGVYDLSYMGPASYISMVEVYGPRTILARLETNYAPTYHGAIVVLRNSPLTGLADLKGKKFAFGDKSSTMGYVVPLQMLWKAGIGMEDLAERAFLKNQEDIALSVLAGHFDAGAVREQVFQQYAGRGLRVLAWSPEFSEHLFVSGRSSDEATVASLRNALYSLSRRPEGQAIMKMIQKSATAFIPARDTDYNSLRRIFDDLKKIGVQP